MADTVLGVVPSGVFTQLEAWLTWFLGQGMDVTGSNSLCLPGAWSTDLIVGPFALYPPDKLGCLCLTRSLSGAQVGLVQWQTLPAYQG